MVCARSFSRVRIYFCSAAVVYTAVGASASVPFCVRTNLFQYCTDMRAICGDACPTHSSQHNISILELYSIFVSAAAVIVAIVFAPFQFYLGSRVYKFDFVSWAMARHTWAYSARVIHRTHHLLYSAHTYSKTKSSIYFVIRFLLSCSRCLSCLVTETRLKPFCPFISISLSLCLYPAPFIFRAKSSPGQSSWTYSAVETEHFRNSTKNYLEMWTNCERLNEGRFSHLTIMWKRTRTKLEQSRESKLGCAKQHICSTYTVIISADKIILSFYSGKF